MTEHSLWRFSRALHLAINDGEMDQLDAILTTKSIGQSTDQSTCFRFSERTARQGSGDRGVPADRR